MSFVVSASSWDFSTMELKLFDSRSVSASEVGGLCGRALSNSLSSRVGSRGGISRPLSSTCRGISLKASYSAARTSCENIDSVSQNGLLLGTESSRLNGMNGAHSHPSSRESYVLPAYEDQYGGIVVDYERLPFDTNVFASSLQVSLAHWKLKGNKGVWLKLPLERSELVPIAVKEGFIYHHAEKEYLMLTYWIPEGPSMLPSNASHQVGVGAFVINNKNEVLVVQEKHSSPAFSGSWKLPTGFILESEEIFTGVVREVKEETGIDTEFIEVIAFRHALRVAFEKSDLFFICMLKPLSFQIEVDDMEIQAAKWMPLVEFVKQPSIQGDSMFKKTIDICIKRLGMCYCGLYPHRVISRFFDGKPSSLYYHLVQDEDFTCQGE
ncbi:nudix hydrolase 8-like [Magnolia sinica]|uniref:nudix hydrolase 8-like n=1 Tax=Magnolia sinica TaxID=86752 RepID=UPI00265990DE|nr:nudix hydrolase 8-like [Magnolia sinica]